MKLIDKIQNNIDNSSFVFPYTSEDYIKNFYFENYHCHKDFTNTIIADSGESIENYAERTKYLKGKCLFSGEHGTQGNQFPTYNVAQKNGLKYIHSSEVYWVKDRHIQDKTNCHMIIAATNDDGRKDINYILSMANIDGYYYRPRIDMELLFNIPKENVIVTSACIAGWNYEDAQDIWLKIADYFQDNFFFEVQTNNTEEQKKLNYKIMELSKKYGIQTIIGLDSHYIGDIGKVKRDQILKYKKISYPEEEGWYMDYPDAKEIVRRMEEQNVLTSDDVLVSLMNTNVFTSKCSDIVFDKSFKIPSIYKNKTYKEKCKIYKNELNKSYKNEKLKSKEKEDGIRYEAKQVIDSGVVDYFLTSKEIVRKAIEEYNGILTTTSRGSAASFITNKLLGLTTVDRFNAEVPIYPERFLTKERVDAGMMPDIDLNIATQEPFVKASKALLGEHGCYPLMAIEKLKEKAAWQLYAGVNNVSPQVANQISKYIDSYNHDLKYLDDDEKDSIHIEDYIPEEYIDIYKKSNEYQNITINLKCHACGHFIFDGDIRREVGLVSAISETTGKRTLCAAIEGGYLDEFGYVKEDFLIVDSVCLTYKFFDAIGMKVPSFDELREMIRNDDKTWEIYEKGITVCVNQCEKEATMNRGKVYKPKNLGELASFIAAIRPGFASLLSTFLDRKDYTTGENEIDLLLEDTSHFMIFQESIMKVLGFLGMDMGETYGVIKSISKKKLKGEKKEKLLIELKEDWEKIFYNFDNFQNVWKVIESSAAYAFNSPHALSMAGDSAYQAWFKAHHTKVFYEVAINHYQEKNKKEKISALIKEAIKFYGYKLGDYKFGNDNRKVTIDEKNKIIYPNMSSLHGFGEEVANVLYELGKEQYESFLDILIKIKETSISNSIIISLIKINYFSDYGDVNTLLEINRIYKLLYGAKTLGKKKIEENDLDIEIVKKYGNETEKQINKLDSLSLIKHLIKSIEYKPLSTKDILDAEKEILGIISYKNEKENKRTYYVEELECKKKITNIVLHEIYSGEKRNVKIWNTQYNKNVFEEKDILFIYSIIKKKKKEQTGEINELTGKKIYKEVPDKFEYWLTSYERR